MSNDMKIFLADNILADGIDQQILGRNFKSANEDIDGSTMREPFRSKLNITNLLDVGRDMELTMVSDKFSIQIEDGIAYLDYIGEATIYVFPRNTNPDEGIEINLEIYAKDGEDLAYALSKEEYSTIFLGKGIYPGMIINRPVRIIGCGLATKIVPYTEYKKSYPEKEYDMLVNEAFARWEHLESDVELPEHDCCFGDELGAALGYGRPCDESPMICANAFVNRDNGKKCGGINGNTPNSNKRYNNINCGKLNLNCAVIRVASNNVYIEDLSVMALDSTCDILIGIAFASKSVNYRVTNVASYRVSIIFKAEEIGAIGNYFSNAENPAIVDGFVDIGDNAVMRAAVGICNVANAKIDGFLSNSRIFLGNSGCRNRVDFISGVVLIEDTTAFEANGSELIYGNVPVGDVEGNIKAILRDVTNNFENLGLFSPEYPDYRAVYVGSKLNYAILVIKEALACW